MADEWKRGTFVYDAVGLGHTPVNLMNAIQSFLTQVGWERASWDTTTIRRFKRTDRGTDNYWMYNADGVPQACGIQVELDTPNSRVIIRTFLENVPATGVQIASSTAHQILLAYSSTAPNNLMFIGGKKGFYFEDGRDGQPTNLAHGLVIAWEAIPEFNGTDDLRVNLTTQGAAIDLFGILRATDGRDFKLVDARNGNRNYTGRLRPKVCRSVTGLNGQSIVDNHAIAIAPRDNLYSLYGASNPPASTSGEGAVYSFGLLLSPRDGRYRISPLMVVQTDERFNAFAQGTGNTDAPTGECYFRDARAYRQATRFVVVDGTLIPFVNITDAATSIVYRVAQVADNGRPANIGVQWPDSSNVVTVSGV
jgi:hypothetical protein